MSDIPTSPVQLTPERLTQALTDSGYLHGGRVSDASHVIIGTGKMGDNARYTLSYEGDCARAPATLVAKFPAADESTRAMAGAQGAYYNEVMFYRHLAPATKMRTPNIYCSEISEDRSEFVLLMEDMSPAEPGSQLVGESRPHAELCLREAARLASAYYGNTEIAGLDYVASSSGDGGVFAQALMEQYWPVFYDRFGHGLSAQGIAFGERYARSYAAFASRFKGHKTLIHGDFRSENILFHGDTATVVDWQTTSESSALTDVAYFLGGSVETAGRREWERELVGSYREYLDQEGVTLSFEDCWEQYREYAMHGILITVLGACFSAPEERSDRMFMVMIQRHLQQCLDLDSGEFLPQ